MFTIYHSNQVDVLKSLLVELIKRQPLDNPFQAEQILVQSPGMSQWLKMELASELGVAANINFPLPATFIWEQFTHVLTDVPQRSAFNKESMTWKLMSLLPSLLAQEEFADLAQYLAEDEDGSKLYQLCGKIADLFDGYLVYRPEWIASWEAGIEVKELAGEQPWQPILWRALYHHTVALGQSPYHRANLYDDFLDTLKHRQEPIAGLPPRLFVFGIAALPEKYLESLCALGKFIDVHLMFTNPCQYYWGEIRDQKYLAKLANKYRQRIDWQNIYTGLSSLESQDKKTQSDYATTAGSLDSDLHALETGNPLLASLGKLGRDNLYLMSQLQAAEIEAFVDIEPQTLLQAIQSDILNLTHHQDDSKLTDSSHKFALDKLDDSLSFHACHSPMREVEVLHDYLLHRFQDDPELKPKDVIVMVADINAYSPAIQAVFGNASGRRYIPFSISDRSADVEHAVYQALLTVLNLPSSRGLASELLELLETPAILAKFEISQDEFQLAKRWVEEAGIRWGLNQDTASDFEVPSCHYNTWQYGIKRMLLGYAMEPGAGLVFEGDDAIAPYSEVQGLQADLAGKLAEYIDNIAFYRSQLNKTQSIQDWRELLRGIVDDLFHVELDEEVALNQVLEIASALEQQLKEANWNEPLAPSIFVEYLQDKLVNSRISQRFLAGQVNFCTLMPMRSIPFKQVCLLGMNDGIYPRHVPKDGFDLMVGRERQGDRSRRDDDRYLFLEALISAQQSLYISYVGRSIQDNSERIPSVLVSELMEYCEQNYCLVDEQRLDSDSSGKSLLSKLCVEHTMTPYSRAAFVNARPSFANEWLPLVNFLGDGNLSSVPTNSAFELEWGTLLELQALELAELQRFWRLPVEYFFQRRLGVRFDKDQVQLLDEEPYRLSGLERYQLNSQLLDTLLENPSSKQNTSGSEAESQSYQQLLDSLSLTQRAQGKLAFGEFGDLDFRENQSLIEQLVGAIQPFVYQPLDDQELRLTIVTPWGKALRLQGWITQRYQSGVIRIRTSKLRAQDVLAAWIDHLSLAAMGASQVTHLFAVESKKGQSTVVHKTFPVMGDPQSAQRLLQDYVTSFFEGNRKPLAYFPRTALAGIEANFVRGKWTEPDLEKMQSRMKSAFEPGFNVGGEGDDIYIARIWPEWEDTLAEQVLANAREFLEVARMSLVDYKREER